MRAYPIAEHRLSQPQDDRVDVEHRLRAPVDIRRRFRDALDQPQHRARIVAPALGQQQVVGARWLPQGHCDAAQRRCQAYRAEGVGRS